MYTYTYTYMHMYMNLFSKIICLNLMTKLSNKFLELQFGTKFTPPYACIYKDKTETDFLKTQDLQPFI